MANPLQAIFVTTKGHIYLEELAGSACDLAEAEVVTRTYANTAPSLRVFKRDHERSRLMQVPVFVECHHVEVGGRVSF